MSTSGTALVTGGGGAIAAAIARRLDARGFDVVLVDVDTDRMESTAVQLRRAPTCLARDLMDPAVVRGLADEIRHRYPDLTLLVNNVGYIHPGTLADTPPEVLDRHITLNFTVPMHLSSAASAAMTRRRRGDILSIVSMGGILPLPGSAAYSAAKAALRAMLTALNAEVHGTGVRVMGIFPSGVDTPMLQFEAQGAGSALNFLGEVHSPDEVGDACMRALETGNLETYVPYADSISTRFVATVPWIIPTILPYFEKSGEKGREKYLAKKGLTRFTA